MQSDDIPNTDIGFWLEYYVEIQGDKEKLLYELDSVQAELEKCRMISERLQKEKEDALADIDCKREQYDKLQSQLIRVEEDKEKGDGELIRQNRDLEMLQ